MNNSVQTEVAYLAAGCYWCLEGQFQYLDGVVEIEPGFMGGSTVNPTYEEVCTGTTGHAEICRITFQPSEISFKELLQAFFKAHDPTQLNRQGNDIGTQYRSAIFYTDENQKSTAMEMIQLMEGHQVFEQKIVTEVSKAEEFYPTEANHKNYFKLNPRVPYCAFVIQPKVVDFLGFINSKKEI